MTQAHDVRYAGFWRRLGAGFVDLVVFLPIMAGAAALETRSMAAAVATQLLGNAFYYAYTLFLTHRYGGTLGKLAVGIRVAPVEGGALRWRHVWRRSAVDFAASSLMVVGFVTAITRIPFASYAALPWSERAVLLESAVPWYAWVNYAYSAWIMSEFVVLLLNRRRRALHDFIAGTVVVRHSSAETGNVPQEDPTNAVQQLPSSP